MALKAGRVGVYPSDLDKEGHIKQNEVDPYVLPVASSETLGGVKPVSKTEAMTENVGVDANGVLYFAPPASGMKIYAKSHTLNKNQGIGDNYRITNNPIDVTGYTPIGVLIIDTDTGHYGFGSLFRNRGGNNETKVVAYCNATTGGYTCIVYYVKNEDVVNL